MIGRNPSRVFLSSLVGVLLVSHPVAHATVYSWKGADGVLMMSNDPADVPPDQQASAQTYTAKPAPPRVPEEEAASPSPRPQAAQLDAYRRGFDAGLQAADREVALAAELTRAALAAVPQTPPAPIIIQQPAPPVAPDFPYGYPPPYYGIGAPYAPYPFLSGVAVGFVPHRHVFAGMRGRRFAPGPSFLVRAGRMR